MKKIGTITFHASYNHGSCLQAYALQKYIQNIASEDISYEIIKKRINKFIKISNILPRKKEFKIKGRKI